MKKTIIMLTIQNNDLDETIVTRCSCGEYTETAVRAKDGNLSEADFYDIMMDFARRHNRDAHKGKAQIEVV